MAYGAAPLYQNEFNQGMYGTTMGGDQMSMPYNPGNMMGAKNKNELITGATKHRRINVVSACICLFLPWLTFCFTSAAYSFSMHYYYPDVMKIITYLIAVPLALATVLKLYTTFTKLMNKSWVRDGGESASWLLFALVSCSVAFAMAISFGNYNFAANMQPYYDLMNLESYVGVNPAQMRGQELMDAGKVEFAKGVKLDTKNAIGFKNLDTYCVAPITFGTNVLASYDFFAVGKNCCLDTPGGVQYHCGAYNDKHARSGVRIIDDADRDFYRLAVQQAQSAFAIKAIHPLFFHWTSDAQTDVDAYKRAGYQALLLGIMTHFVVQTFLVFTAVSCFARLNAYW
eukprot:TRINITY_DN173_c0_g1_i1.p1 TRINITY_DN173_c0_g1~~TRINITY_DN173_c0_g1_i1.p1  ORF type:complete len:342 (+),score=58.76 TRINITY_DN173_c0_g1_i1:120-1145(+)